MAKTTGFGQLFQGTQHFIWEHVMEIVNEVQPFFETSGEVRSVQVNKHSESVKRPSVLGWYRILRTHYQ